jgi:RNA polymerase sigma-70 factor, ECF subfamily
MGKPDRPQFRKPSESALKSYLSGEERQALDRCRAGDTDAYSILMDANKEKIFSAVSRFLDRQEDVEDVVQEAFVIGYTKLDSYWEKCSFSTWIYGIAANLIKRRAVEHVRQRGVSLEELDDSYHSISSGGDFAEDVVLRVTIQDAILRLPEKQQRVIIMYFFDNMSYLEMASALGCSAKTVSTRLHYGLKKLKQELEKLWEE